MYLILTYPLHNRWLTILVTLWAAGSLIIPLAMSFLRYITYGTVVVILLRLLDQIMITVAICCTFRSSHSPTIMTINHFRAAALGISQILALVLPLMDFVSWTVTIQVREPSPDDAETDAIGQLTSVALLSRPHSHWIPVSPPTRWTAR